MNDRPTYLERAFALAENGSCESLLAIRKQLKAEGYAEAGHLSGNAVRNQLSRTIAERKKTRQDGDGSLLTSLPE